MLKMSLKIEDVMRTTLVTIDSSYNVRQAAKMMDHRDVSSLVDTSTKKLFSIVKRRTSV